MLHRFYNVLAHTLQAQCPQRVAAPLVTCGLMLFGLPACSTVEHHSRATPGVDNRVGQPFDGTQPRATASVTPAVPRTQRFRNMVGEPIPAIDQLPSAAFHASEAAESVLGQSVRGNAIRVVEFGSTDPAARRIYLIGMIHGDEIEGRNALPELQESLQLLASVPASNARIRLIPSMNPDGEQSGQRSNANSVDLNRNWPASNFNPARSRGMSPASEPETAAVLRDIELFRPDVIIVFHSIDTGPFVNYDGPTTAEPLARAFADAANHEIGTKETPTPWAVVEEMGYPTPGSLGTWAGVDRKIPTLTVEFRTGQPEDEATRSAIMGTRAVIRKAAALRLQDFARHVKASPVPDHP